MPESEPLQNERTTLTVLLDNEVKVSFLVELPFGRYREPERWRSMRGVNG